MDITLTGGSCEKCGDPFYRETGTRLGVRYRVTVRRQRCPECSEWACTACLASSETGACCLVYDPDYEGGVDGSTTD